MSRFRSVVNAVKNDADKFGHVIWALPLFSVVTVLTAWLIAFNIGNSNEQRQREVFDQIAEVDQVACERESEMRAQVNANTAIFEDLLLSLADALLREAREHDLSVGEIERIEEEAFALLAMVDELEYLEVIDCGAVAIPDGCQFEFRE